MGDVAGHCESVLHNIGVTMPTRNHLENGLGLACRVGAQETRGRLTVVWRQLRLNRINLQGVSLLKCSRWGRMGFKNKKGDVSTFGGRKWHIGVSDKAAHS